MIIRWAILIYLMLLAGVVQAQDDYFGQWNLHLAQLNPTHNGDRMVVAVIPLGGSLTTTLTPHWLLRYNVQYAHRKYNSSCRSCKDGLESIDQFDQVEIGAVAYYDIGEPYSEKRVQVLFGLGFVAQYTFAQQSYQGTSWSVLNGTQELRSFGVYGTAPVLLSVRLNPRVRFELGSELRIGGKNVAFQDRSTSTVNAQRLVSESDQSFSDVGLVFYPAYASLGLLINRDRKEREADKQE